MFKEWDYNKNKDIDPNTLAKKSKKKYWFKCQKGHSYLMALVKKSMGQNCPYCSNRKVLKGFNDVKTTHPELLKEWDYEKNNIKPTEIPYGFSKKVWWKCMKCGNSYSSLVNNKPKNCKKCNNLISKFPEIVKEWDYEKNYPLTPDKILYGSNKAVWWKCIKCNHSWKSKIKIRTREKYNASCPVCLGNKIIEGYNDLFTLMPCLEKEWDYGKNKKISPKKISKGSHKKAWWLCSKCGYSWETIIYNRTRKTEQGCPRCNISKGENKITTLLQENNINFSYQKRFNKCRNILPLPFDFYLPDHNICIEYDGEQHFQSVEHFGGKDSFNKTQLSDKIKTEYCTQKGIRLIRIKYNQNIEEVLNKELLTKIT